MKRVYGKAALLMAVVALLSAAITHFTAVERPQTARFTAVASFYPVYTAAKAITADTDTQLLCLTQAGTGCVHDYQLTSNDMLTLSSADVLLLNGAGAESFLDDALAGLPSLRTVDSSIGISLLPAAGHEHHDGHDHDEPYNEHIWVSPPRYLQQLDNLCNGLCDADPANAARYRANTAAYQEQVRAVWTRMQRAAAALPMRACVTVHESLDYLVADLGLEVIAELAVDEESGVSAGALSAACDAVAQAGRALVLYDVQYTQNGGGRYAGLEAAGETTVLEVDTAVLGDDGGDAWLRAMTALAAQLEAWGG